MGWKKQVDITKGWSSQMLNAPYTWVKDQLVSFFSHLFPPHLNSRCIRAEQRHRESILDYGAPYRISIAV